MAPYQFSLTMAQTWKGKTEEFSNVWFYDVATVSNTPTGLEGILDQLHTAWKPLFPGSVSFLRGRVNGPTNLSKIENVMEVAKDYTDFGTATGGDPMMAENAIHCWLYMGRGPLGGKQILRKYIHGRVVLGATSGGGQGIGTNPLSTASKALYTDKLNALKNITQDAGVNSICNAAGKHIPVNSNWTCADYIVTRQFRRGS